MTLQLTKEEAEEVFFDALCNGLSQLTGYGLMLSYRDKEYREAREHLVREHENEENYKPCLEDILMRMLKNGHYISVIDTEDDDSEHQLVLNMIYDALENVKHEDKSLFDAVKNCIDETGDADDSDTILQSCWFGDIMFG